MTRYSSHDKTFKGIIAYSFLAITLAIESAAIGTISVLTVMTLLVNGGMNIPASLMEYSSIAFMDEEK